MLKIGSRLRELRSAKRFSQEYLAYMLEMTQGNYCKLESDYHFPCSETLERIAKFYGISTESLFSSEAAIKCETSYASGKSIEIRDSDKLLAELLISKEKIIALQEKQIEILESKLKALANRALKS